MDPSQRVPMFPGPWFPRVGVRKSDPASSWSLGQCRHTHTENPNYIHNARVNVCQCILGPGTLDWEHRDPGNTATLPSWLWNQHKYFQFRKKKHKRQRQKTPFHRRNDCGLIVTLVPAVLCSRTSVLCESFGANVKVRLCSRTTEDWMCPCGGERRAVWRPTRSECPAQLPCSGTLCGLEHRDYMFAPSCMSRRDYFHLLLVSPAPHQNMSVGRSDWFGESRSSRERASLTHIMEQLTDVIPRQRRRLPEVQPFVVGQALTFLCDETKKPWKVKLSACWRRYEVI